MGVPRKRVMGFDADPVIKNLVPSTQKSLYQVSTYGFDLYMQRVANLNSPVTGGYRAYQLIDEAIWDDDSIQARTAFLYPQPCVMNCLRFNVPMQYTTGHWWDIASGRYNDVVRRNIWSRPRGVMAYDIWEHEGPTYALAKNPKADPRAYRAAMLTLNRAAIEAALERGLTPDEYGCGGLTLTNQLDEGLDSPWAWQADAEDWMLESGFLVNNMDYYFKCRLDASGRVVHESFKEKTDRYVNEFSKAGFDRHVVAETTLALDSRANKGVIIGTTANQRAWIKEVDTALSTNLECVAYFHSPDGPASGLGPLRGEAAMDWAYMSKRYNRPVQTAA